MEKEKIEGDHEREELEMHEMERGSMEVRRHLKRGGASGQGRGG